LYSIASARRETLNLFVKIDWGAKVIERLAHGSQAEFSGVEGARACDITVLVMIQDL